MQVQKLGNQPSFQSLQIDYNILRIAKPEDVSKFRQAIEPFAQQLLEASKDAETLVQPILRHGRIKRIEVSSHYSEPSSIRNDLRSFVLLLLDTFKPAKYIGYTQKIDFKTFTGEQLLETVRITAQAAFKRFG